MKNKLLILLTVVAMLAFVLAACTPDEPQQSYSVTFDWQTGKTEEVKFDGTFALPAVIENGDKVFEGWFTDKACTAGSEWTVPESLTANITVYAKWTEQPAGPVYTVTFDAQNGEAPTTLNAEGLVVPTPTNGNKIFGGWYTDADCTTGNEWTPPEEFLSNMTVYAKWTDPVEVAPAEVFAKYQNPENWNFQVNFQMGLLSTPDDLMYDDVLCYDGLLLKYVYEYDGALYTDYVDYENGLYYMDNGDGTWDELDENDWYFEFMLDDVDYIEISTLNTLSFATVDGWLVASDATKAGNEILGEWSESTWKSVKIMLANGELSQIVAVFENSSQDYAGIYAFKISFTKHGQISVTLPATEKPELPTVTDLEGDPVSLPVDATIYGDEWNFVIKQEMRLEEEVETTVVKYCGEKVCLVVVEEGKTYTDYLGYNAQTDKFVYFYQTDSGYELYWEDDEDFEDLVYSMYLVDFTDLADLIFVAREGYYSAKNSQTVGIALLGEYEESVWTAVDIYVADGKITKLVATLVNASKDYAGTYTFTLTFEDYGNVDFELPEVTVNDDATYSKFTDKNLATTGPEYISTPEPFGFDATKGVQFTQGNGTAVLTSKQEFEGVMAVTVTVCTNQDAGMRVSVSVGGISFQYQGEEKILVKEKDPTDYTFTFDLPMDGQVEVTLEPTASKKSMYILAIDVSGETEVIPGEMMPEQVYDKDTFDDERLQKKQFDYEGAIGLPSTGEYSVLVVPVQFAGGKVLSADDLAKLEKAFNGTPADTGWQSVHSYYQASSFGKLNMSFDIQSVYTAQQNASYYERYSKNITIDDDYYTQYGDELLLLEVLSYLEDKIDLSKYDSDNDGTIDAVYLIYANPIDYDDTDFWWAYVTWYYGEQTFDGKDAYYYLFAGYDFIFEDADTADGVEYNGTIQGLKINAATFIHETGHLLALDDYYDYNPGKGADVGVNGADMMDNTVGDHGVYSKIMMGWLTPTVITQSTTFTIDIGNSSTDDDCVMLLLNSNNSYFCEYLLLDLYSATGLNQLHAQQQGTCLFAGESFGARIYHITSWCDNPFSGSYSSFTNCNNSDSEFALVKLVQADGGINSDRDEYDFADAEDLWQTGDVFSDVYQSYTRNDGCTVNFDITFDSVTATTVTITVTFVTAE